MNTNFGMLFLIKKAKTTSDGMAPIFIRLTLNAERIEISCKRNVLVSKWNASGQRMIGTNEDAKVLNAYLKTMERQMYDIHRHMIDNKIPLTTGNFKRLMTNGSENVGSKMLMPIFQEHNKQIKALVGKEYAAATYTRYETSLNHVLNFMKWKYKIEDIHIEGVNHEFVTSFDFYLRTEKKCNNNTTVKYMKNFKKIILNCLDNGWLDKDPFLKYKAKTREVPRAYLTSDEIDTMRQKEFATARLNQVRDIFVFSCFTGLAYADVKKLKRSEIVTGLDRQQWIFTARQKTETPSRIPILPPVQDIIRKYIDHPECGDNLLPVLSNQKTNSYLKEIADVCGIQKELTFHIARHSFATSITMANGVSIESVSKMLGHRNIRTTQHYAKILDAKVSEDMMMLTKKLKKQFKRTNQHAAK